MRRRSERLDDGQGVFPEPVGPNTHVRLTEAESALEGFPDTISIAESGIRVKRIRCHLSPYVA